MSVIMIILDAIEIIISTTDLFKRMRGMCSGNFCNKNQKRKGAGKNLEKEFSRKYEPIDWKNTPI